eukprot:450914-Pelagomonas_calceolata.AAC.1
MGPCPAFASSWVSSASTFILSGHTNITCPALSAMQRNMARVCSFFAKGTCTRGAECPYRHEMPTTGELSEQNIKDR